MTPSPLLLQMGALAREAGQQILEIYHRGFEVDYKAPGDPVTEADRRANAFLCERLAKVLPAAALVAEESEPEKFAGFRQREDIFFIDPLDGTREFVARNDQFVVMIGLVRGDSARMGVVYSPTADTLWAGELGAGSYRQVGEEPRQAIGVSELAAANEAQIVVSRSRRSARLARALSPLAGARIVPTGSAGLKGAVVAEGSADAYVAAGPCGKLWDCCAVDALVSSAGGRFTDAEGGNIDYRGRSLDCRRGILAANPPLHDHLLKTLFVRDEP